VSRLGQAKSREGASGTIGKNKKKGGRPQPVPPDFFDVFIGKRMDTLKK